MAHRNPPVLLATAGPRIHSPRRSGASDTRTANANSLLDEHLQSTASTGREAADLVILHLRENPLDLLPWSLDQRDPVRHFDWLIPSLVVAPVVPWALGTSWIWSAIAALVFASITVRLLRGRARRVAKLAHEIQAELSHGTPLADLSTELEILVRDDPDLEAARVLLAQLRLEIGDPLGALMQLAPLRDRHPDEGSVVLLAALAYVRLGAMNDALRMLDVLSVEASGPWDERVARLRELCHRSAGAENLASSGDEAFES